MRPADSWAARFLAELRDPKSGLARATRRAAEAYLYRGQVNGASNREGEP